MSETDHMAMLALDALYMQGLFDLVSAAYAKHALQTKVAL
jgi:hypothetical protein